MKIAAKFIIVVFILIGMLAGINYFITKPAETFCSNLSLSDTPEAVMSLAGENQYHVFDRLQKKNKIIVTTQDSPFFRFACVATFKDGRLVDKEVVAYD